MLHATNSPPTVTGAGHHWTVSTNIGCNQWLSLAKTLLKVTLAGRNRSMVARTNKCGWAISLMVSLSPLKSDTSSPLIFLTMAQILYFYLFLYFFGMALFDANNEWMNEWSFNGWFGSKEFRMEFGKAVTDTKFFLQPPPCVRNFRTYPRVHFSTSGLSFLGTARARDAIFHPSEAPT